MLESGGQIQLPGGAGSDRNQRLARDADRQRRDEEPRVWSVPGESLQELRQHHLDERQRLRRLGLAQLRTPMRTCEPWRSASWTPTSVTFTRWSLAPEASGSLDDANWTPILGLDAAYTYYATYDRVLTEYNRANHLPVFMVEANYEFEQNCACFDYGNASHAEAPGILDDAERCDRSTVRQPLHMACSQAIGRRTSTHQGPFNSAISVRCSVPVAGTISCRTRTTPW